MRQSDWGEYATAYRELAERFGKGTGADTIQGDFEDLSGFSVDVVRTCLTEARRTCRYFPRPVELIGLCIKETNRLKSVNGSRVHHDVDELPICQTCGAQYRSHRILTKSGKETARMLIRHGRGKWCERYNETYRWVEESP